MISTGFSLGILIVYGLFMLYRVKRSVNPSRVRDSFFRVILATELFITMVLLVRIVTQYDGTLGLWVGRMVFFSGGVWQIFLGVFVVNFLGQFDEQKRFGVYSSLQFQNIIITILTLTPFILADLRARSTEIVPVYGPLHLYYLLSLVVFDIYLLVLLRKRKISVSSSLFKWQLSVLQSSLTFTLVLVFLTAGLIPFLFHDVKYVPLSGYSIFFLYTGIFDIINIVNVQSNQALTFIITNTAMKNNIINYKDFRNASLFREIMGMMQDAVRGIRSVRSIPFMDREEQRLMHIEMVASLPENYSVKMMPGCETDFQKISEMIRFSLESRNDLNVDDFRLLARENREKMMETYGTDLSVISAEMQSVLHTSSLYAKTGFPLIIQGEQFSGRTTLAKAIHNHFARGDLIVADPESLLFENDLQKYEILKRGGVDAGIVIKNVEKVESRYQDIITRIMTQENFSNVYVTTDKWEDDLNVVSGIPGRINCHVLEIPPLRKRPEDIALFLVKRICDLSLFNQSVKIKAHVLKSILEHPWNGNFYELNGYIANSFKNNAEEAVSELDTFEAVPAEISEELQALSPLEICERNIIVRFLHKNGFNKTKTGKELKIAANTLKAKIKKYGIPVDPQA